MDKSGREYHLIKVLLLSILVIAGFIILFLFYYNISDLGSTSFSSAVSKYLNLY